MNDKELIKKYCEAKNISKHRFCTSLGLSPAFLDSGTTLSAANLRLILEHEQYSDFNLIAFMQKDPENIVKSLQKVPLGSGIINQAFIFDTMEELDTIKNESDTLSTKEQRLIELLKLALKNLSTVSEDYSNLYKQIAREVSLGN